VNSFDEDELRAMVRQSISRALGQPSDAIAALESDRDAT
jgi:hypothetical protein